MEALDFMAKNLAWKTSKRGKKIAYDGLSAPWWTLDAEDAVLIRDHLVQGKWVSEGSGRSFNAAAVNRFLAALRGVLRICWRQGLTSAATYLETVAKLKSVSSVPSRGAREAAEG